MTNKLTLGQLPERPEPLWRGGLSLPIFNPLEDDCETDVAIVGGGITGITAAYLLSNAGKKVVLIDADRLLNGTTGHTTAKVTAQHDLIYDEFISHFGQSIARLYYEANMEAFNFIKNIIEEHNIDCDYSIEDAFLYATTDKYAKKLQQEWNAYQKLHIEGKLVTEIPFNIKIKNALVMNDQAQFHPLKYLSKLVTLLESNGVQIYEHTTAVDINEDGDRVRVITLNGKSITASQAICCSHFPFYEGTGFYFTRMYAERSYALAVKTEKDYPGGMYLSVDEPSRSLRSASYKGEKIIIIAGEKHKTGQGENTLEHYKALEGFGKDVVGINQVLYRWSTQDLTTLDKIPYVGEITRGKNRILVATGYRKWGMTNSTVAAMIIRDKILGTGNRYLELYQPSRFYIDPSLKNFFIENTDVVKHFLKGKLELPHKSLEQMENDEAIIIRVNGNRKGVYKDHYGKLHIVDTTCTHLGCEVNWNQGDRTWDCPCHGSRFSFNGAVIEGPAEKPLLKESFNMTDLLSEDKTGY
nr:FAD-dependent oxidoreductase [Desulfuribacillus alkaliarsenatis]